jgi:hypothetical protein
MIEFIKLGGGIAGIIALLWRILEVYKSYIQIELEVKKEAGSSRIQIDTAIENKSFLSKELDAAFLIVGPENESPGQTVAALQKISPGLASFQSLNEMVSKIARIVCHNREIAPGGLFDNDGHAIIPLTYYYWENIGIGDERLTCSCTIDMSNFPPGPYAIRFYVEPKRRYYRSVQKTFEVILPAEKS